jgi:hypothetical protein
MHAPCPTHHNEHSVQIAVDLHNQPMHVQRYQSWWLAQPLHILLMTLSFSFPPFHVKRNFLAFANLRHRRRFRELEVDTMWAIAQEKEV